MKSPFSLAAIALAFLGVSAVSIALASAATADRAEVKTKVTLAYEEPEPGDPYGRSKFGGTVKANKGCAAKRSIKIAGIGSAKTTKMGDFEITVNSAPSAGAYVAKVKKATIEKGGKKVKCAAGESKPTTVS